MHLEELAGSSAVAGLTPVGLARVIHVEWFGANTVKVTFERPEGGVEQQILGRDDEVRLAAPGSAGRLWSFDGDGEALRLVSEAHRIRLAHLFDPYLAVHTSHIEPLPHQITAVYGEMLGRQPLRFLLADDPGAGKTIMAGLFIKELMIRGDVERCLIVAPGSLVEQWQDELNEKFDLPFDIMSRDLVTTARTGNPFAERALWIARMDMLSRAEDLQTLLTAAPEFDLVICDEAHRMSATRYGNEVQYTQRHQLGQLLSHRCRHFLLLTATPHNGKEDDFQLFLSLLDGDRFEGRPREGTRQVDVSDLMRRLTKEELRRFDGKLLFPERRAYTAEYQLSPPEAALYAAVTDYVRQEMSAADRIGDDGKRRQNVGFALQILQRRLASSPEAIYRSLSRRRARLERRLTEEELRHRADTAALTTELDPSVRAPDPDDLDDAPEAEVEQIEQTVLDQATAARTLAELRAEIATLQHLEEQALSVRRSGQDAKWRELESILDHPEITDANGARRKLIIFTEPRDTLEYLANRIRDRLGRPDSVVIIHGGIGRDDRRKVQEAFMQDPRVLVLVANDAAGEGVNLQRAHLMVNYDLPWNPNRLEQRFGRIHRIGQTEVCHLWNLVAPDTREGEVYARLLEKLDNARVALGGRVYDVLGQLFQGQALRELLIEAIRYGDRPEVRARLNEVVDNAVDQQRVRDLLAERALVRSSISASTVEEIRRDMERAAARRLQPHFISGFFLAAFQRLGGRISRREPGRWEITHVPQTIRRRDRQIGRGDPVLDRYERICFDRAFMPGPPVAKFVCPGHPLLDSVVDLIAEQFGPILLQGATLIDDNDNGAAPRALAYIEHSVTDGRQGRGGVPLVISRRLQFVEITECGRATDAGPAPYLDYRPTTSEEQVTLTEPVVHAPWLSNGLDRLAETYAVTHLVPEHTTEIRRRRMVEIEREEAQVEARLRREIIHWDAQAARLKLQEEAGQRTRLPAAVAQARANDLEVRLKQRKTGLDKQRAIAAQPPRVIGGALVVPAGLLRQLQGERVAPNIFAEDRGDTERLAMDAVMEAEQRLGRQPRDVSAQKLGYDIESWNPRTGALRCIEVKGRMADATDIIVTRNEIVVALNRQDDFVLAIGLVRAGFVDRLAYVRRPFTTPPDFGSSAVIYRLADLLQRATEPA